MFETVGKTSREVVGTFDKTRITVDFATGYTTSHFSGRFPDGSKGGSWSVSSQGTINPKSVSGRHYLGSTKNGTGTGTVLSANISNLSKNCANGCSINSNAVFGFTGNQAAAVTGALGVFSDPQLPNFSGHGTFVIKK